MRLRSPQSQGNRSRGAQPWRRALRVAQPRQWRRRRGPTPRHSRSHPTSCYTRRSARPRKTTYSSLLRAAPSRLAANFTPVWPAPHRSLLPLAGLDRIDEHAALGSHRCRAPLRRCQCRRRRAPLRRCVAASAAAAGAGAPVPCFCSCACSQRCCRCAVPLAPLPARANGSCVPATMLLVRFRGRRSRCCSSCCLCRAVPLRPLPAFLERGGPTDDRPLQWTGRPRQLVHDGATAPG